MNLFSTYTTPNVYGTFSSQVGVLDLPKRDVFGPVPLFCKRNVQSDHTGSRTFGASEEVNGITYRRNQFTVKYRFTITRNFNTLQLPLFGNYGSVSISTLGWSTKSLCLNLVNGNCTPDLSATSPFYYLKFVYEMFTNRKITISLRANNIF